MGFVVLVVLLALWIIVGGALFVHVAFQTVPVGNAAVLDFAEFLGQFLLFLPGQTPVAVQNGTNDKDASHVRVGKHRLDALDQFLGGFSHHHKGHAGMGRTVSHHVDAIQDAPPVELLLSSGVCVCVHRPRPRHLGRDNGPGGQGLLLLPGRGAGHQGHESERPEAGREQQDARVSDALGGFHHAHGIALVVDAAATADGFSTVLVVVGVDRRSAHGKRCLVLSNHCNAGWRAGVASPVCGLVWYGLVWLRRKGRLSNALDAPCQGPLFVTGGW
mmetsp:Transcript_7906/g.23307  ORF Transcript_7906/g.23307 Transcript_7906/m.23307 type:complete len:274 (-) Transcript_7906:203-1024(-)